MTSAIQVVTTTDNKATAQAIAEKLVACRLAACVQIEGPITSVYRWQDKMETSEEWRCVIKTVRSVYLAVEHQIRDLHTYEEPEIVVVAIHGGSQTYLNWLENQLQSRS